MIRFLPALFLALSLVLSGPAGAQDLATDYTVSGIAADGTTPYSGTVQVAPVGDTYSVVWQFPNSREVYLGTGILRGSSFAVVYQSPRVPGPPGLVLYDIAEDGGMTGYFSVLGAKSIGAETWTPVSR
ncbi:MAG: hypothetical protein VR70_04865 [Rhodospirillaceae bacterium BRH_c57]|nr:MAG: hypothetical protein VR70_04865 [Rhodospirillaceae bacterium BRH_c57]